MSVQQHSIKRLVLKLDLRMDQTRAFHMQEDLKRILLEKSEDSLDAELSRLVPADQTFRIPYLELDLNKVTKRTFGDRFVQLLQKRLLELYQGVQMQASQTEKRLVDNPYATAVQLTRSQRNWDLFFHFLQTGTFPWWAKQVDWKAMEQELVEELESPNIESEMQQLKRIIQEDPRRLRRLVWQCSIALTNSIIQVLQKQNQVEQQTATISNYPEVQKEERALMLRLEALMLDKATPSNSTAAAAEGLTAFSSTPSAPQAQSEKLLGKAHQLRSNESLSQRLLPTQGKSLDPHSWHLLAHEQALTSDEEHAYYIQNAGLALIIPCLTSLFQELKYLDENRLFKSLHKQKRAILLLQYLATGKGQCPETELVLNKIVCGWPLDEPLEKRLYLSKTEKESGEQFLKILIQHWGALKRTSPEGLRYNFLMRAGKLSFIKGHWLLQVENAGYDAILLAKLPWTISICKYKWMPERIHVEWIN